MFSSSYLNKSCIGPDNSTSGRNNALGRFPVGITSVGDENQQTKIQLAVHKYNSSANSALNSTYSMISPSRHSFLKNSLKARSYEEDAEGTSKNEKKKENQYEGVGAFPTIHLKKSAVRYRPIKRFNDVKIPYPELPVSRFLSHLPEACTDLKSSTRSVLDVLEDLSGKNIHMKDDNGTIKPLLKGLGGESPLNPSAVYKPLFVEKPKLVSVLTRDNTTQTFSSISTESPSSQNSNSFIGNHSSDPKAELRRKLAKQNNEILASLSSSISSSFPVKRKIDKVLSSKADDDNLSGESVTKKSKVSDFQKENGDSVSVNRFNTKSIDLIRKNVKSKLNETNSPTSPNKDRLTTIFLEMRNTSPKTQMFQINPTSTEIKSSSNKDLASSADTSNGFTPTPNGFTNEISNSVVYDSFEKITGSDKEENSQKNTLGSDFAEKPASLSSKKEEITQSNKAVFNFSVCNANTAVSNVIKSTSVAFQFGTNSSNSQNLEITRAPIGSDINSKDEAKKKDCDNQVLGTPFAFGSSSDKPNFSSFRFGDEGNTSTVLDKSSKDLLVKSSGTVFITPTIASVTTVQSTFGTITSVKTSTSETPTFSLDTSNGQNTLNTSAKALFTFGQNASPYQPTFVKGKNEEKAETSNSELVGVTNASLSIPSSRSNDEQRSNTVVIKTLGEPNVSTTGSMSSSVVSSNSSSVAVQNNKSTFTFGQKSETPATTLSATQVQNYSFSFGEKSDTSHNKAQEGLEQKSPIFFSFGQKSVSQESSLNTAIATNPTVTTSDQNSQMIKASTVSFGQTSSGSTANGSGTKSEAEPTCNMPSTTLTQSNTTSPMKNSLFTPSTVGFGSVSAQVSSGFQTTSSGFGFGVSTTTQSTPAFVVSSAPPTTSAFGASNTPLSSSGFGSSNTTQSASNQSSFGVTTTTQTTPAFGTPSVIPSSSSFGVSTTIQTTSVFGTSTNSQAASGFGTSSTTQSTSSFGTSPGFLVSSPSKPDSLFGTSTSTQPPLRFGASAIQSNLSFGTSGRFSIASTQPSTSFGTSTSTSISGFGNSQSSFTQPCGSKSTTSLGQVSSVFGQNSTPSFPSSSSFNSIQNNGFVSKPVTDSGVFDQSKIQTPGFGQNTQLFNTKFPCGMSTSNATGFTNSPPNTTAASVFNFGSNTTGSSFTFGSNTPASNNTQTPFGFKSSTNEPFKFGATTTESGFGGASTTTFTFGNQVNNNVMGEQKPAFQFRSSQVSSAAPFTFGTTPSPSVFSFGNSSSASSGSSFNWPNPNGPFGQTASPGTPFSVPGTFSIGSGSSQSRPRATLRPRRRL